MTFFSAKDTEISSQLTTYSTEHQVPTEAGLAFKGMQGPLRRGGYEYRAVVLVGYKEAVYTYSSSASPLCGSFGTVNGLVPYLPAANEFLKIASTSANDTAGGTGTRTVAVIGLDQDFNPAFEIIPMNGQTPVTTTTGFYRIGKVIQLESGTPTSYNASGNKGIIYLAANSATFTAGVPTNSNLIAAAMLIESGTTNTTVIPVKAGAEFFLSELTIGSTVGNKTDVLILDLRVRQNLSGWRTLITLEASTTQPVVTLKQSGFQSFTYPFLPGNSDISMAIRRVGGSGTTDDVQCNVYMTGYIVTPI